MTDITVRYLCGMLCMVVAMELSYLGAEISALIPAVASIYILGCLLYDVWRKHV